MNFNNLILSELSLFCETNNLEFGICKAEPFYHLESILNLKNDKLKGFVLQDIKKRIDPSLTLNNCKSIVVLSMGYNKILDFKLDYKNRCKISVGAVGLDYHTVLKSKFDELANIFLSITNFNYNIFVDTGPLLDREVALRSNIGYIGKNGALITKKFGAMNFLGYMLTDLDLPATVKNDDDFYNCGECFKCIKSCPTNAISKNNFFDHTKCISYLTQTKNQLSLNEQKQIGYMIYGCDCCALSCPKNNLDDTFLERISSIDEIYPEISFMESLSNREFKNAFGHTAIGWRGNSVIKRNVSYVSNNLNT